MKTNIQQSLLVKPSNDNNIIKKIFKMFLEHISDIIHRLNHKRIENQDSR